MDDQVIPQDLPEYSDFEEIELSLESLFVPLNPRSEFVGDLLNRLLRTLSRRWIIAKAVIYSLLAMAGLVSGMIILATGIRATITLLGTLGIIRQVRNQAAQKRSAQTRSV